MNKTRSLIAAAIAGLLLCAPLAAAEGAAPAAAAAAAPTAAPAAAPAEASAPAAESAPEESVQALHFETPDAAAMELIEAAAAEGADALIAVLGPELEELVSGDPVADAADRAWFVERAGESAQIEDQGEDSAILVVGNDDWPFPIPLAKDDQGWYFDTEAGIEEVLDRRIGRNELQVLATMRAFVDAEREYAAAAPQGDGVHAYADRLLSAEGKKDGLYWPTKEGEPESPMGALVAQAAEQGYDKLGQEPSPFHGYRFKLLKAQGERAPGGAKSYVKDGRLTEGVALLAWPATYGNSGIMTFQVSQRGVVYQADLGEETAAAAAAIDAYNPGDGWEPALD